MSLKNAGTVQICNHERVMATNSTSIKLFIHVQNAIAAKLGAAETKIKVYIVDIYLHIT